MQNPLMGRLIAGGGESSDVEETPSKTGFVSDIAASHCEILGRVHSPRKPKQLCPAG